MESASTSHPILSAKCCDCDCRCHLRVDNPRLLKRKIDWISDAAPLRVEVDDECAALREAVAEHQRTIDDLCGDLDEERNAAASAADEAMSMILRLQRDKAELLMESTQYRRIAEERMTHDQLEIQELEEELYKREQLIDSLNLQILEYKNQLQTSGCCYDEHPTEVDTTGNVQAGDSVSESDYEYPPLKCDINILQQQVDLEKYALGDAPNSGEEHLQDLKFGIDLVEEKNLGSYEFGSTRIFLEKANADHHRKSSQDSTSSSLGVVKEVSVGKEFVADAPLGELNCLPTTEDNSFAGIVNPEFPEGEDDRVYTIDSVHRVPSNGDDQHENKLADNNRGEKDFRASSNVTSLASVDSGELDIKKLYMRLETLEADRESMKQALVTMATDRAQLLLFKEIARRLCIDLSSKKTMSVRKPSILSSFSFTSILKWLLSFFWRKKTRESKCMRGLPYKNLGLLLLLELSPQVKQWRCLSRGWRV